MVSRFSVGFAQAEIQPPETYEIVHKLLNRAVAEPAAFRSGGRVFKQSEGYTARERIILPLSTTGLIGDGVLRATEYDSDYIIRDVVTGSISEDENWRAL
jgi:hypothetical protein